MIYPNRCNEDPLISRNPLTEGTMPKSQNGQQQSSGLDNQNEMQTSAFTQSPLMHTQRKVRFSSVQVRYHEVVYGQLESWNCRTLSATIIREERLTVDDYSTAEITYQKRQRRRRVSFAEMEDEQSATRQEKTKPISALYKLLIMAMIYYFTQDGNVVSAHQSSSAASKVPSAVNSLVGVVEESVETNTAIIRFARNNGCEARQDCVLENPIILS